MPNTHIQTNYQPSDWHKYKPEVGAMALLHLDGEKGVTLLACRLLGDESSTSAAASLLLGVCAFFFED